MKNLNVVELFKQGGLPLIVLVGVITLELAAREIHVAVTIVGVVTSALLWVIQTHHKQLKECMEKHEQCEYRMNKLQGILTRFISFGNGNEKAREQLRQELKALEDDSH